VRKGKTVILVRQETSPEDLRGMSVAKGILTARGGMTSHAAVVARGMGKCCISGAGAVHVDYHARTMSVGGETWKEGEWLSLDGSTGDVFLGQVPTKEAELTGDFGTLMDLADRYRRLGVRANADTPEDAKVARNFGAKGIGLCRTEHMFFEGDRIKAVREMILADDEDGSPQGAGEAAADAARRLRGPVPRDERSGGHHPPARSAVARVRSARRREPARDGARDERAAGGDQDARRRSARVQPDDGSSRLSSRHHLPGNHRDADARHPRGRPQHEGQGNRGQGGNHDSAGRHGA
jgi:phosphohistidine swiveling domain-containing protein